MRGALEMLSDLTAGYTAGYRDVRNEGDQPRPCESRWQPRLRDKDEEEDPESSSTEQSPQGDA